MLALGFRTNPEDAPGPEDEDSLNAEDAEVPEAVSVLIIACVDGDVARLVECEVDPSVRSFKGRAAER